MEKELTDIIEKMDLKKYENFKKEILKNSFIKFLQNGTTEEEKQNLINIIKNINWYWTKNMFDYYSIYFSKNFDEKSILIDYSKDDSSSSKAICTYLQNSIITTLDVIRIEEADKIPTNITKIFLLDDFIGSGNTILRTIEQLENLGYKNKEIYIISYICLNKGKFNIENFQSEKNKIILKYNVLENSYLEKGFNRQLIKYIKSICSRCKDKLFAFGYENCGTMLSINGTSSNNNLSLLYRRDIENWNNLLDRDLDFIILNQKRNKIIKERKDEIAKFYFKNNLKEIILMKEFEVLILLYNCYGMDVELLKKFNFFATLKECEKILQSLYSKRILKEGYFIEIINPKILQILKNFDKYIDVKYIKNKSKKFY